MKLTDHELRKHYGLLLGIEPPWQVQAVDLDLAGKRVEIALAWSPGGKAKCPVCGQSCALYDLAPERTWRHLDTMQFETVLRARVPRVECLTDGVKTLEVPWAEPQGRFSRLFERFAIDVLLCARSLTGAAGLMGLSWDEVDQVVRRAVKRGLSRRQFEGLRHLGIDEKNFMAGQSYISVLTDLEGSRVLEVVEGRTQEAAELLWETLRDSGLKVAHAWAAKELFSKLWMYRYEGAARRFFRQWYGWVSRSRLKPLIKVAKMLKQHLENILTYLRHPITNAATEGLNSKSLFENSKKPINPHILLYLFDHLPHQTGDAIHS